MLHRQNGRQGQSQAINAWTNYLVLLLVPIAVIISRSFVPNGGLPPWAAGTLATAFFFTLFYTPCGPWEAGIPCTQDPSFLGSFHFLRTRCQVAA